MTSLQVQGRQHKALQQLIPDFSHFLWVDDGYVPQKHEKLLPPKTAGDENEVDNQEDGKIKVGVFLEPHQHMALAVQLEHLWTLQRCCQIL